MVFIKNKEVSLSKWRSLIKVSLFSSPFQTPEFWQFYNSVKGFFADVFAIEREGLYTSLVVVTLQREKGIKSFFSRRGIIYGGPLILNNNDDNLLYLIRGLVSYYKKKLIYLEVRNLFNYTLFRETYLENGFSYTPWLNFHCSTSDELLMKKRIHNSRLRQIKKAQKHGVSWEVANTSDEIKTFYQILKNLYSNKIKKPLPPEDFFLEAFKKEIFKYLLVYYGNKIIGGIMCAVLNSKSIYEIYICGLNEKYHDQYPSVMATWAAMEYANQNKILYFDFMGAGRPNESYGVREFKDKFGGELIEYGRYIRINNRTLYKIGQVGLKMLG